MFTFFQAAKNVYYKYTDPLSYQLMEILWPDTGIRDHKVAQKFIVEHQNEPINFYITKSRGGTEIPLIRTCFISKDLSLIDALLSQPSMKNRKTHDWEMIFECMTFSLSNPEILSRMINYFKPQMDNFRHQYDIDLDAVLSESSQSMIDLDNSCSEWFDACFSDYPPDEIWRLFIDGKKQRNENGWLDYESREPGCIKGMMNGFLHLKQNIAEPLTVPILLDLHAACSTDVNNLSNATPGKFRNNSEVEFGFVYNNNVSLAGLLELVDKQLKEDLSYKVEELRFSCGIYAEEQEASVINQNVESIINRYNQRILECKNTEEKISAIVDLITSLERLHPFSDANCRTICIFLLNRELIRNGFPPVILEDPNRFDGFSNKELIGEIAKGMYTFEQVKHGNTLGITTEEINNKMKQDPKYADHGSENADQESEKANYSETHKYLQANATTALQPSSPPSPGTVSI